MPDEVLRFEVPGERDGMRLSDLLRRHLGLSRGFLRRLRAGGWVEVGGAPRYLNQPVRAGEQVALYLPPGAGRVAPEPLPLNIRRADSRILVVDKPAGLVTHPTRHYKEGTLANAVAYYLAEQGRPGPVHLIGRLDRDTSGLVLVALDLLSHRHLERQRAAGKLRRTYLALVSGAVAAAAGCIDLPLGRDPAHSTRRRVDPDGRPSVTLYRVRARYPDATLLELELQTGRTHQIRAHVAHLGHPLLGDDLYGGDRRYIERHALHAWRLSFAHPATGRELQVEAPLPPDLAAAVALLQAAGAGR